jgi:hypothetical protein
MVEDSTEMSPSAGVWSRRAISDPQCLHCNRPFSVDGVEGRYYNEMRREETPEVDL